MKSGVLEELERLCHEIGGKWKKDEPNEYICDGISMDKIDKLPMIAKKLAKLAAEDFDYGVVFYFESREGNVVKGAYVDYDEWDGEVWIGADVKKVGVQPVRSAKEIDKAEKGTADWYITGFSFKADKFRSGFIDIWSFLEYDRENKQVNVVSKVGVGLEPSDVRRASDKSILNVVNKMFKYGDLAVEFLEKLPLRWRKQRREPVSFI